MKFLISIFETLLIYLKIIFSNRDIILGPYHGEFGFEVSMNVSIANSLKKKFKNKIIVVSQKGNMALYKNVDLYLPFSYNLAIAGYGFGNYQDSLNLRKAFLTKYNVNKKSIFIDLSRINIFLFKKIINFEYIALGNSDVQIQPNQVSLHFRSVLKTGNDDRLNFNYENADKLVYEIFKIGFTVNIIGHPEFSYCPNHYCIDCRSYDINFALNAIQKSMITIGQLSGPIHLSHLCKRPVITWADDIKRFKTVEMWNPFNQECYIVSYETFNPEIQDIIKKLHEFKNK